MPKDNHSVMQLYLDGFKKNFYTFFFVKENNSTKINTNFNDNRMKYLKNKNLNQIKLSQSLATENVFRKKNIVELTNVGDRTVLELFHGPTLAFKDIAMQLLGNFYEYYLNNKNEKLNIVVATSGDTGAAAIDAIKGKKNINILVEKPIIFENKELKIIEGILKKKKSTLYTAYNHRFEPHIVEVKRVLDQKKIGKIYNVNLYYGNGTSQLWKKKFFH